MRFINYRFHTLIDISPRTLNYHAMLLGGALGDAIGSAIEFSPWSEIALRFGPKGLQEPAFRPMNYTDDTQMTLFAAEAVKLHRETGSELLPELRMSIRYWHATQNIELNQYPPDWYRHPLIANAAMLHLRSPGHTCLQYGDWADGTLEYSINSSKGNGGAMRIAPLAYGIDNRWEAFKTACKFAAMTHGHPDGYVSAGALTSILHGILRGQSIWQSVDTTLEMLDQVNARESDTYRKLAMAVTWAETEPRQRERIEDLGRGFTGEEAVAIAVYSALSFPDDFKEAVRLAINHGGDSDTCGLMAGQIMGALLGMAELPKDWISSLESTELEIINQYNKENT
jgi:ADP-ribosyl-[dinitrogen reductase] hydrolase